MQKLDYKTTFIKDSISGDVNIVHTQKVDHILDTNKLMAENSQDGKDMKLAARIPLNVIYAWEQEGIVMSQVGKDPEMTGRFWRKLQDPHWAKLRVWKGKIV